MRNNRKKVLVDLSELKNLYCGLGQVALAYGNYFKENYRKEGASYSLTLLMPRKMFGIFGDEVDYIDSTNWLLKRFRFLFPTVDVWHAVHQLSRFKPSTSKTKFILTIHDLNYLYETTGKRRKRRHRRLQRKVNRADYVVFISNFTREDAKKNLLLKGKPSQVIYNGVEDISLKQDRQPVNYPKDPFFFTIGVVRRKKNFHVLLDMMKLMPEKQLYIAGSKYEKENYYDELKSRIEIENIRNVILLGPISQEEKVWYFKHCEAFLFPSLFEGFGLPVIEAMQFGKPVFSSRMTSLEEIGGDFSFFWDSFEPMKMKQLIDENLKIFYHDCDRIQREINYARSFSYERHFREYEKLYSNI